MLSNINEYLASDIEKTLGKDRISVIESTDPVSIKISTSDLIPLLNLLKSNKLYDFKTLIDIFGVDYPSNSKRFEVNYSLLSIKHNYRVNLKIEVAEDEEVPSIVGMYNAAGWFEREVWDMYGVKFTGNSDLRRILTDYEFEGHPLRKDFPLTGHKEVRYDFEKKKIEYKDITLTQEYRNFDFKSPWKGTQYKIQKEPEKTEEKQ
jgi:NADH-quinone oxidoreductase subunit C